MALPPGPRTPSILALLRWIAGPTEVLEKGFREHGDLYTAKTVIYGHEVMISHPDLVKQIFAGDPEVFQAGVVYRIFAPLFGDRSVMVLDGRAHKRERKLLMPLFHGERLGVYADVMRDVTSQALERLPLGETISILPCLQRVTFDVILDTVFGVREGAAIEALRARLGALMEKVQSPLGTLWLLPALQKDLGPLTGWASLKRSILAADEAIYGVIAEARAAAKTPGPRRPDVLSLLLAAVDEEGQPMSDQELRDELITMLVCRSASITSSATRTSGRRLRSSGRSASSTRSRTPTPGSPSAAARAGASGRPWR
jgi:cytochrome P450 family 110